MMALVALLGEEETLTVTCTLSCHVALLPQYSAEEGPYKMLSTHPCCAPGLSSLKATRHTGFYSVHYPVLGMLFQQQETY